MQESLNFVIQDYFQKSRSFLFPVLNISRNEPPMLPQNTFVAWQDMYTPKDCKLLCLYPTVSVRTAERLANHLLFESRFELQNDQQIFVFDLQEHYWDYELFLAGRYSQLSDTLKTRIKLYFGSSSSEYAYMASYLFPEKHYAVYAGLLGVDTALLAAVGELCDKPDPGRELLGIPKKQGQAASVI